MTCKTATPECTESNALSGWWREVRHIGCEGSEDTVPATPVERLYFGEEGQFSVEWDPSELFADYWGTYSFDPSADSLSIAFQGGRYVPARLMTDVRAVAGDLNGDSEGHKAKLSFRESNPAKGGSSGELR